LHLIQVFDFDNAVVIGEDSFGIFFLDDLRDVPEEPEVVIKVESAISSHNSIFHKSIFLYKNSGMFVLSYEFCSILICFATVKIAAYFVLFFMRFFLL